jgi:hypothetical protein
MGGVLDSPWLGVAEAGLATMGGTSPFAAVNIGRGGLTGIQGAITQQQQKVEIGLKRAEAEKSQADADMQRMLVKAQGIAMRGMEGAVDSSGGGGGSGVTDVSARSGGGSSAQGVMAYAPYAGTLMNQAAYMARFPQLKGMSEYLEKQAEADPLFIRGQEMIKKGLMPQPDGQGGFNWVMPSNTREQFQQLSLLGPQAADKPTIMYGPNGDPQRIIWSSVGADGKTTQNVVPYTPEAATAAGIDGGSGNGGGGQQDARPQVQPWADASAHMPVETFGKKYAPVFDQAEQKYQLTPGLLPAMAWTESHFNPNAISPKGAEGPLQFMPQTAKDYDVNARDVGSSINGAGHMMSDLLTKYHGNATRALAAYNWGAGHVDKWVKGGADISRLPPETQRYILSVRAAMEPGAEPPGIAGGAPAPSGGGTTVTVDGKPAPTGGTGVTTADPYATTKATQEAQTVGNYTGKFGTESETANVANNRIDQMLAESHTWNPGKPAEYWGNMKSWLAPLYPNSEALQKSVADQAQFNKNVGALQRDVTSSLGSGIASSEFDAVGKTLINQGMTRRTVVGMAMQFKGLQDFQIARNLAWANKDALMPDVTDKQFMGKFQQEAGPAAFVLMEAHHAALGGDADAQATYDTIKNSLLKTAEGRATLKHISQQVQWIEDNNLFQQPGPQ